MRQKKNRALKQVSGGQVDTALNVNVNRVVEDQNTPLNLKLDIGGDLRIFSVRK